VQLTVAVYAGVVVFLSQPFVGGLSVEAAVGALEVVEVLPFLELGVE
jgi:hypothetical protein